MTTNRERASRLLVPPNETPTVGTIYIESYKKTTTSRLSLPSERVIRCIANAMNTFAPLHLGHEETKRLADAIGRCFDLVPYFSIQTAGPEAEPCQKRRQIKGRPRKTQSFIGRSPKAQGYLHRRLVASQDRAAG